MPIKKIIIEGKTSLVGDIQISGAKNSALKLICASILLKNGTLKLNNIPNLLDTATLLNLMNILGCKITLDGNLSSKEKGKSIILDGSTIKKWFAPYEIVSQMRASFNVLGPLLSRFGQAKVSLPGGCAIGARGLDIHFDSLEKMGVNIKLNDGYVEAIAKDGKVRGANLNFRFASVGATENIMMASILAIGKTKINNAAREPEIIDLANCLNQMGAKITGAGTSTIEIEGVEDLHSTEYTTMGDRMEAGAYMIGALITNGDITLSGLDFDVLNDLIQKLIAMGADINRIDKNTLRIKRKGKLKPINVITDVYPKFPTDLQSPMMTLLATVDGKSEIDETIFENRFMHVPELNRMNANINVVENKATIEGSEDCYKSAQVMATDLRAGISLIFAGIASAGLTEVRRFYHVERGYEYVIEKLGNCGAKLKVVYE